MKINDLQKIIDSRSKKAAEKALGFEIKTDVWKAAQALKEECGRFVNEWPTHWVALLSKEENPPEPQNPAVGGAAIEGGAPKQSKRVRFKDLTESDKVFIRGVHKSDAPVLEKFSAMNSRYGIASRTVGEWFKLLGLTESKVEEPDFLKEARNRTLSDKKIHLFTAAQNATPINQGLWKNMLAYAKHLDADIHVVPTRYKNPNSLHADLSDDYWSPEVLPFLDNTKHWLSENLVVLGDLKIQPTAEYPLRGLNAISRGATAIIGHQKMHLEAVPTLEGEHKQRLWSTGALTIENYTDSRAGAKGESHHIFGFLVVELDGDSFHIRQVPATDSGEFQDLWWVASGGEIGFSDEITAAVLGDVHLGDENPQKIDATVNLLNMLKPKHIALHDLFNGHSVNHHEIKDPVKSFHRIRRGRNLIKEEVENMLEWLHWFTQEFPKSEIVVVRSNHCQFLDRHISDRNWKDDLANAQWYMKCLDHLLEVPDTKGLVPYFIEQEFGDRVTCLSRDTSYRPGTYQLANHGDLGSGGSRGTPLQYAKMSTKQITGHTHTPARINGLLVVGTSTHLRLDYNIGPSSWGWADVIEYKNGKATHILYDDNYRFTIQKYPV